MRRAWHAHAPGRPWYIFGVPLVAVCRDVEAAAVVLRAGALVVLCGPDAAALGDAVASLRAAASEPPGHRLAGLVGDLGEPETEEAARAMARELFGGEPVVVPTAGAAQDLLGTLAAPNQARSDTV
jgi:hypothetical protein